METKGKERLDTNRNTIYFHQLAYHRNRKNPTDAISSQGTTYYEYNQRA
jgi:hypothetical protein